MIPCAAGAAEPSRALQRRRVRRKGAREQPPSLIAGNRTSEVARIYREVLRSDPIHVPGIFVVLSDCRTRGAVDEAIDVATRALAVDREHFIALQTLAWAYVTQGNHSAARVAVAKALERFRAQRLDEPSNTLRAVDVLRRRRAVGCGLLSLKTSQNR